MLRDLEQYFLRNESWLMGLIESLIKAESPSGDAKRLDEVASILEDLLVEVGAKRGETSCSPRPVLARFGSCHPRLGLIFHHDTVWPVGSFPNPRLEKGCWFGPGIFDMKANIALMLLSLKFLASQNPEYLQGIWLASSPDEEILGAVSSEELPAFFKGCPRALVFEPPLPDGQLKQRRKGSVRLKVRFLGKASHTGNHYQEGRSALAAAARFLVFAEGLSNVDAGFTINIGRLSGGSAVNTRPGFAEMDVDVRMVQVAQWEEAKRLLNCFRDIRGVVIEIEQVAILPPMDAQHPDWEIMKRVCSKVGSPFALGAAGGGSDGSRLADMGIRVMDGLGVLGGGEHAEHEHIQVAALKPYFKRNTLLLRELLNEPI